jgi:outer membrane receptor protein involved in Fe transport
MRPSDVFRCPFWRSAVLLLAMVLGSAVSAAAQATGGVVVGTVTDAQGGVLPGVTLTARNAETGALRTAVSDGNGRYRLVALPPGHYNLTANLQGFATQEVTDLPMRIDLEIRHDFQMTIESVQETVTVTGEAPVVETTRSEVTATVTQEQIDMLPIESRQAVSLALLMPGTGTDSTRPRRTNTNIGTGSMSMFSSNYTVDGVTNMSTKAGEPRQDYPQSAIGEFKVYLQNAPAEYGGRTGGVIAVVTKSGTNRFSGEAFEFFRDKSLNAMNKFEKARHDEQGDPKPDFRRHQFGGALGGPIIQDRLHFMLAAERTDQEETKIVNTGEPQFYSGLEGPYPYKNESTLFFVRGDYQISPQQNLFLRYASQGSTTLCEGCGGSTAANAGLDLYIPRDSLVVGHTWVIGTRTLNEFRFARQIQWHYQNGSGRQPLWKGGFTFPDARFDGLTPIYDFPSVTWGSDSVFNHNQEIWEWRDDLTMTFDGMGSHNMKLGFGYDSWPLHEDRQGNTLGTWQFANDQYFDGSAAAIANLEAPIQFSASYPPLVRHAANKYYQVYVQDEWRPRSNLTLNLGLRYELQTDIWNEKRNQSMYPKPIPIIDFGVRGDKNNWGPRFGFAWDVKDDGRSLVRGGYGLIYHVMMSGMYAAELDQLRQSSIVIRNPSYPDPYGGRDPLDFASTALPNIDTVSNDMYNAKANNLNVGYTQELTANMALHTDVVYSRVDGFPTRVLINTPDPDTGAVPYPQYRRIRQYQPVGVANYRALFLRLDKRYSHNYQYMISYTLSKNTYNWHGGTSNGYVTDLFHPEWDEGPANADRRHVLVASGAWLLPYDVTLGAVWSFRSSMPFTALAGKDLNKDRNTNDYVPGTTLNQGNRDLDLSLVNAWRAQNGRGAISADQLDSNRYMRMDLRVSKAISLGENRKLELIAQVFNVLGTDNLGGVGTGWVTSSLSNSFGRLLQAQPRQQAELAARITF